MDELLTIIKTIISTELDPDEGFKTSSFILEPYMMDTLLKGDGKPTESAITYQLDVFFKNKGELIAKSKLISNALEVYMLSAWTFRWESVARVWRGTVTIQKLL